MNLRKIAGVALASIALSFLSALPAQATMKPVGIAEAERTEAAGFIVRYKSGVAPIAPNGEPTGENFSGVDLENVQDLGGGLKSIDFANTLPPNEAANALARVAGDPRIASVQLNRYFQTASLKSADFFKAVVTTNPPITAPLILKSAIAPAVAPASLKAADAWSSPNLIAVRLSWKRATSKIAGYRIQMYVRGFWKDIKYLYSPSATAYKVTSSYLRVGVSNSFRVAALKFSNSKYYTGAYSKIYAKPTSKPKANTRVVVNSAGGQINFSWAKLSTASDRGGLAVTYKLNVTSGGVSQTCANATESTCSVNAGSVGSKYAATLVVSNGRGSASTTPITVNLTNSPVVNPANDTYFNRQWYLEGSAMNVTSAWVTESGSSNVVVAVLDTGITQHPDLDANILPGYDMVANDLRDLAPGRDADPTDPGDSDGTADSSWHGTHVAGIIGAIDNGAGVVGVAPNVSILPVRVLGVSGGSEADIVAGLNWAAGIPIDGVPNNPNVADVINLSISGQGSCDSATSATLGTIKNLGITVVTASGNDGDDAGDYYPGNCYPTINVAASGPTGKPTFYSNYEWVDIAAPGGDFCPAIGSPSASGQIYSTLNSGKTFPGSPDFGYELGTSMAAPNVSGVVALMYSAILRKNPNTTRNGVLVERIWAALDSTARPLVSNTPPADYNKTSGKCVAYTRGSHKYGPGVVNAQAAVAAAIK